MAMLGLSHAVILIQLESDLNRELSLQHHYHEDEAGTLHLLIRLRREVIVSQN